jgi:copper chaperone CopZ
MNHLSYIFWGVPAVLRTPVAVFRARYSLGATHQRLRRCTPAGSRSILALFLLLFTQLGLAQTELRGKITDEHGEALIGATVLWENTTVGTVTDLDGAFSLPRLDSTEARHLHIRFVGYETVIIPVNPQEQDLAISIDGITNIEEINVIGRQKNNFTSTLNPINTEIIGKGELRKAPCCNLSESFETNPTIDVQFSDAITGAKEIEMLGLRGIYSQLMIENRPALSGIPSAYNMEFIPGTWLSSIQISKGVSTVLNGPKSITGQINVELEKPSDGPKLFVNLFANHMGRAEINLHSNHKLPKGFSVGLLAHGNLQSTEIDHNHDGFMDMPKKRQLNLMNRWFYEGNNFEGQLSIHALTDRRDGGQVANGHEGHPGGNYHIGINNDRLELIYKTGFIGFKQPFKSIGFMANATWHKQTGVFGDRNDVSLQRQYLGEQRSLYANLIYETIIKTTDHKLRTGASYALDDYRERFMNANQDRVEHLPGAFVEYIWNYFKPHEHSALDNHDDEAEIPDFVFMAGFRLDYLNTYGLVYTPRVNMKYSLSENAVLRASAGRGFRTANAFSEYLAYMPGSRVFEIQEKLLPEFAWNYGINYTQNFKIGEREGNLNFDFYRTDFENQLVADIDSDPSKLLFYNLKGRSFSNSFIVAYTQEIVKGLELKFGYKFNDVRTTFGENLDVKALLPQHRGLANIHYSTPKPNWEFNFTAQFVGSQRLPAVNGPTDGLPAYRLAEKSPGFVLMNAQVTKSFGPNFDIYLGAENLGNYRQVNPIINAEDPFNTNASAPRFDATAIFAPVMGTVVYAGLRYTLDTKVGKLTSISINTSAQCGMCEDKIEGELMKVPGIASANLNLDTKQLQIQYKAGKINPQQIRMAVTQLGYDADDLPANPTVYENLPACCKKE